MLLYEKIFKSLAAVNKGAESTPEQQAVVRKYKAITEEYMLQSGMSRRQFLKSQMGMAAFFLVMNDVFGNFFSVSTTEAAEKQDPDYNQQFIFDAQVHFVRNNYPSPRNLLVLRSKSSDWNPKLKGKKPTLRNINYESFYREVFLESQTKIALLSNAPSDRKAEWFITNEQAMQARKDINARAGTRVLLAHALFTPGQPGWMEELDRALAMKPDGWKGYTLGDPMGRSKHPWRLDDEKLVYPAFEKFDKAGIRNVCIHKGLLPANYRKNFTELQIKCAGVDDVGKAARDWPRLNFIIYHSAIEKNLPGPEDAAYFRKTGRIPG